MKCSSCEKAAIYRCTLCGRLSCGRHVRLSTICRTCARNNHARVRIERVRADDRNSIKRIVESFWGEEIQLTFDREFNVASLNGYVARVRKRVCGFVSIAETDESVLIVALAVLPKYQNLGIGRRMVERVESEARVKQKRKLLVSTSNDDLPALGFYQSLGFRICEVKPNLIANKHDRILVGIGGLPVRDELRLQKIVST